MTGGVQPVGLGLDAQAFTEAEDALGVDPVHLQAESGQAVGDLDLEATGGLEHDATHAGLQQVPAEVQDGGRGVGDPLVGLVRGG